MKSNQGMKKIIGVVGSYRLMGNTEVSVLEALKGAESVRCSTEVIRLTDYEIRPCRGCMACVFKNIPCPIEDDAVELLDRITQADGLVLGVPTYILGTAGILKMLNDRGMGFMAGETRPAEGKPALGIVTAGIPGWEGLAPAMTRIFLASLGFNTLHLSIVNAQGPAEVVLNEAKLEELNSQGVQLARAVMGETIAPESPKEGECPFCHESVVSVKGSEVRCLICGLKGRLSDSHIEWESWDSWRWQAEDVKWHFDHQVRSSGPKYKARFAEIRKLVRQRYGKGKQGK